MKIRPLTIAGAYEITPVSHGDLCGLSERAVMTYLCSEVYAPAREHTVHPLDPELAIEWPTTSPLLSARDAAAPSLAEARERGLLPDYGG